MQGAHAEPLPQPQPAPPPPPPPTLPRAPHVSPMLLHSPSAASSSSFPSSLLGVGGGLFSLCGLTPPISPAATAGSLHAHPPSLCLSHSATPTSSTQQPHPPQATLHMFLSAPSSAVPSRMQSPAATMHEHDVAGALNSGGLSQSRDGAMTDSLGSSRDGPAAGARFSFSFNSAGGFVQDPHAMMMLSHSATHSRSHSPTAAHHAFASPPQSSHTQLGAMQSQSLFALNSDGSAALAGSPHLHGLMASMHREGQISSSALPSPSPGVSHPLAPASLHPSPPYTTRGIASRNSSGDSWSHNRMDMSDSTKAVFEVFEPAPQAQPWHARLHVNGAAAFSERESSSSTFGSSATLSGASSSSTALHSPGCLTPSQLQLQAHTPPSLASILAQANHNKLDANSATLQQKLESLFLSQSQSPPQRTHQMQHEPLMFSPHVMRSQHASPAHAQSLFTPDLSPSSSMLDVTSLAQAARGTPRVSAHASSSPAAAVASMDSLGRAVRGGGSALLSNSVPVALAESHGAPSGSSGSSVLSSPSAAAAASAKPTAFVCEVCQKQFTQKGGLQNHARIHKGERPFKCEWDGCDKAFAQKCNLTRHQRCHTGEKPYKCALCPKAYNRRWGLLVHSRLHGRDVPVMHKQRVFPKGAAAAAAAAAGEAAAAGGTSASRAMRPRSKALLEDSDSDYDDTRDAEGPRSTRSSASLSSSAPLLPTVSRSSRGAQTNLEATSARLYGLTLHSAHSPQREAQHRSAFASRDFTSAAAAFSSSPPLLWHPGIPSSVSVLSSVGLLEFASSHPPSLLGATRPLRGSNTATAAQRR